jgi:Fe-Mn family superoxide dismutase
MVSLSRRDWIKLAGVSAAGSALSGILASSSEAAVREYVLPDLPYPTDALEPHLDAKTLTIHHDRHHAGYVRGLNSVLKSLDEAGKKGDYGAIRSLSRTLAFHGSGHVLHSLYFSNLAPKRSEPFGALAKAIQAQFGGVDSLEAQLAAASRTVAGSGWGVLAYEPLGNRLVVLQVEKHENQLLAGAVPLLVLDVWEHAYYINYQNRRADYLKAVLNVLNWEEASGRFETARRLGA